MGTALAPTLVALYLSLSFSGANGLIEVREDHETVVLELTSPEVFMRLGLENGLEPMFGSFYRLHDEAAAEVRAGRVVVSNRMPAYRDTRSGALLIADGKMRIKLKEGVTAATLRNVIRHHGGTWGKRLRNEAPIYSVIAATPTETVSLSSTLLASGLVEWAVPDFIYQRSVSFEPNDEYFEYQWHHDRIDSGSAWDLERGEEQIVIAILDSGVQLNHPDLEGKLVEPYDALDQDTDPTPNSSDAHGTACAALAAASTNNNRGVAGVCPNCSIMPIRIMSEQGWGRYGADSDAFYWAIDKGAQILSNSWGPAQASDIPANLAEAISYAAESGRSGLGAVVLFASGNEYRQNYSYELPSHPLVLGVGATGAQDYRENYSNYGYELDIVAPAGSVTADITGNYGYASGSYSFEFGGTSAATPVAAGVVGLVLSVTPNLTREQVFSIMKDTADQVGSESYSNGFNAYYGHGRVNALAAVQAAGNLGGNQDCLPTPEDCTNGIDDDCDGLIDRDDPACAADNEPPADLSPAAGACGEALSCEPNAFCYDESNYGIHEGFCGDECGWNDQCDSNYSCIDLGSVNLCLNNCQANSDCRSGYACNPIGNGDGVCWQSCLYSGCPDGESCNEYGLCGNDEPPVIEPPEDLADDPEQPAGEGDVDPGVGSEDGDSGSEQTPDVPEDGVESGQSEGELGQETPGATEVEAPGADLKGLEGGCQSTGASLWTTMALLGLGIAFRRRREALVP